MKSKIKNLTCLALSVLLAGGVVCGSGCVKPSASKPSYDINSRTPTDEGETVVTLDQSDYEYYHNYVELYDGDGAVYDIGDPFVFRYNGKYYLYTSLNGNKKTTGKIPCWVSDNLVDWEWGGWAYDPHSTSVDSETYIAFAPEVVYYKGYFYMCESRRGQGHFFFRSTSPTGPFTKISDNLGMGIDGSFYLHDNGQLYFISANDTTTDKRITYYEIDFVEKADGSVEVEIDNTQNNVVEGAYLDGWTEGPGYFKRNGYSYFTYAGNHVDSAGYKVAYSYVEGNFPLAGLSSHWNNTTLISTGMDNEALPGYASKTNTKSVTTYRGLGHSSNVIAPNLDGIYTAYHNANRIDHTNTMIDSARKYNLTQYFTNGSYLLTNGLGNYQKTKPQMPDIDAKVTELETVGNFSLTKAQTESTFTSEISFTLNQNRAAAIVGYRSQSDYYEIAIDGTQLVYSSVSGGNKTRLASASVQISTNAAAVHTIKTVNGSDRVQIYYDNMLSVDSEKTASAGKLGVAEGTATCIQATNDAFGTSDFDAVKDLTGSWPASAYMKGENRGFSFKDAKPSVNGVRQGEAERTRKVESLDATALTVNEGEWIKYTVNAPYDGDYGLGMLVGKQSAGCVFEIIVDNETITKAEIPSDTNFSESEFANISAGTFSCSAGLHTLKIRVYDGTLDFVNVYSCKNGETLGEVTDPLTSKNATFFKTALGSKGSFTQSGYMTNTGDERTLLTFGSKGVSNYEFSVDVRIITSGSGGIMFRMNDYSYTNYKTTQLGDGYMGYYLQLNTSYVGLYKNNYNKKENLGIVKPSDGASLKGGSIVRVTVSCLNGEIRILLNDEEVFSVVDTDAYLFGYVGLYSEEGACFMFSDFEYQEL